MGKVARFPTHSAARTVLQNDASRAFEVISELMPERARLLPGDTLQIDVDQLSGPMRITLYDGGLQIDFGDAPQSIDLPFRVQ